MSQENQKTQNQFPIEEFVVGYRNWRGECQIRRIIPSSVYFGITEWHPKRQWLMRAYDADKDANRDFALGDFFGSPKIENSNEILSRIRAEASALGYELVRKQT